MVKYAVLAMYLAAGMLQAQVLEERGVYLEDAGGGTIRIATLKGDAGAYSVELNDAVFSDHFLSMRPFRCIEGPVKTWCHVPYPYEIRRDIRGDLVDLEYDFLFVWKDKTEYGIDMWNGVYYVLEAVGSELIGAMHEVNMDILAVPPEAGERRPIRAKDLEPTDPESHWLPVLRVR